MTEENTEIKTVQEAPKQLEERDRMVLALASANLKAAAAQHESAEMSRRNVLLQLFMKYGLNSNDAIDDNGNIIVGGASK